MWSLYILSEKLVHCSIYTMKDTLLITELSVANIPLIVYPKPNMHSTIALVLREWDFA